MSEQNHGSKKTNLSKAVFMALPLLAASGIAASAPRNSSVSSSRRGMRASVVHVDAKHRAQSTDVRKRGVFSAFGRSSGNQVQSKAPVNSAAIDFLRENGLLQSQAAASAQVSGELVGRKVFASDSPFAHCHTGGGTWFTNTTATNQNRCINTYSGTWHPASTKPSVTNHSVQNKTATAFDVALTLSESATAHAVLLLSTQPVPSSAQVIAGTDGANAAAVQTKSQAMNTSGTLAFTGLTSGTEYRLYIVAQDATETSSMPTIIDPSFEYGMAGDTAGWQFPKVRVASNGDFYMARSDSNTVRFYKWNGAGFTLHATLPSNAIAGRTVPGWGNDNSIDYEVDASGHLHVLFSAQVTNMLVTGDPYYGYFNGTTWTYTAIGETGASVHDGDLFIDPNGKIHTSFRTFPTTVQEMSYATNQSGAWVITKLATTNGGTDEVDDSRVLSDGTTAYVFYMREDDQNVNNNNYYLATSADGFAAKTLVIDGKGDGKHYTMTNALIDDDGHIHYAYADNTDKKSYYRTNASGSWVDRQITNSSHTDVSTLGIERAGSTYYFASRDVATYFMHSFDGSTWVTGRDFGMASGYMNDRFAIDSAVDRIMFMSENAGGYTVHYHTGPILSYITPPVLNNAPTDIALSNSSVNQSGGTNATVGTLSTTDADVGDTFTYTLVAGTGDTNNASFNISGSTLRANNAAALAAGNYSVRVQTSDGSASYAEAFTITVADNVAPTVSSVSVPANDTYAPGESLNFTVNTGENITVNTGGGTPRIALTIGSTTRYATYASGSGTSALVFTYTVQAGDFDGDGIAVGALEANGGTLRDAASNNLTTTLNSVGSTATVFVDAVPPSAPSTPDMTAGTDSGSSSSDNITNDTTPTFTGTSEVGATVTVISSVGGTLGTTTADGSGNWSFTPGSALSGGAHNITATATDAVGNTSSSSSALAITIDTVAVTGHSVSFTDTSLNASQASAISFSFASAEVGAIYSYSITSSGGGTAVTGNGTLASVSDLISNINVSGLASGTLTLSVVVTDSAGNAATAVTDTATLDADVPTVSSVNVPANNTYVAGEALSFTVNFNDSVTVDTTGGTPRIAITIGSTTRYASYVSGSGTSALVFSYTVQAGDNDADGIAVGALSTNGGSLKDSAGNDVTTTLNSVGSTNSVLVDAVVPNAPSTPDMSAGTDTGSSSTDNLTADTTPTFTGTAEPNATITLISSVDGSLGTTTADGSGNWSFTPGSALSGGNHNITATATDAGGNISSPSAALAISIDSAAVTGHSVSFTDTSLSASQASAISFSFASAEVGATYSYSITSSGGGTAVTGNGTLASISELVGSINVSGLGDGTLTLSVVVTDSAGNAASAVTATATLDATAPTVAITSGVSNPTNAAFQATVMFSEAVTGFVVGDISASNASLSNFTDNGGGAYSVTVTPTSDGTVTLNVAGSVAQDAAGNNNSAATQFSTIYDTGGPTLSSTSPADNATGVQYNTNIALTFNESVNAGSGNIAIHDAADDSLVDSIAIGSASINGATVTFDPGVNLTPTHTYYILVDGGLVEDALGNGSTAVSSTSALNFTVGNNAPSAAADSASTNEDNAVDISVLTNDSDVDSSLNPASVTVASAPAHGSTSVNTGTGVITYTPTANYHGSDSFTYTVGDTHGGTSNAATVTLTVSAVNDNPVAVADVDSTPEDTAVSIDVAANDSDIDTGDSIDPDTIDLVTQPTYGSATVNNGEVLYTPTANFNGSDSFTYRVQDQNAAYSNTVTVIVNVSGVNDAPTATNDSATTDEDTAVDIDLVDNDSDIDGSVDATSVTVMAQPANGSVSINATTGVATYTPNANHNGSDSFTYVVQDNEDATSAVATVSLTITSVNDAPVAANDTVNLQEDTPHAINALGNDSDVDGTLQSGTLEIVTAPTSGTTSINAGVITYTPNENFGGSDSLTYRVQDNQNAWSNTATIAITVEAVNDEPLANDDSAQTDEDTDVSIDLLANDSDVDGTLDMAAITIVSAPTNGSLLDNGDGTVTYTPAADFFGSDSFTYTVADNQAGVSNTATVSIDVQPVNDAPVISGTPTVELLEGESYSFIPTFSDVDNTDLVFSTGEPLPAWLTLNTTTGEISGTPQVGDAGEYTGIQLIVSDGTLPTALTAFDISVLGDNDTDGTENTVDTDDDNDGMSDTYEETHGFNPLDDSDASADADGDTLSNLQEFLDDTDPGDASDYYDVTAPVITAPQDLIIDAVALHTPVALQQLLGLASDATSNDIANALGALTTDNVDGSSCCGTHVVNVVNNSVLLSPGSQSVTYRATDRKGNTGTATQTVHVRPLVSVNKDQISVEGATVQFRVILNGPSPFYPLTVPYVIDNMSTAGNSDHDLIDGSVEFNSVNGVGQTVATVSIQLLNDAESEADETLIVRLDDQTTHDQDLANGYDEQNPDIFDINSGAKSSHMITITEQNVAPDVNVLVSQSGINTSLVTQNDGVVTLTANIVDPNSGDTHMLDWSATDNRLTDTDGHTDDETFVFDPSALSAGSYFVSVVATDGDGASDTTTLYFRVIETLPVLSDQDDSDGDGIDDLLEGTGDSDNNGIPDYLDNMPSSNVLPESGSETNAFLVECDPGVRCRLGQFALVGNSGGVRLEQEDFNDQENLVADTAFNFESGIFDFEVHDLPTLGQSVRIALPQITPIPENAVYRKLINGRWINFVENADNALHSAPGNPGYCPPPGDSTWEPGLVAGYHCVQLTLQDGGPNDADGRINAAVQDPGGVAVQRAVSNNDDDVVETHHDVKSKGKGGGGSVGLILAVALIALMLGRRTRVEKGKRGLARAAGVSGLLLGTSALGLLPASHAQAADWNAVQSDLQEKSYVSASFYQAKGSQTSSDFVNGLENEGVPVDLAKYEESRTAWQIGAGYRYHDNLALEFGYLDLGESEVNLDSVTGTTADIEAAMSEHYPVSGHGWTLSNRFLWRAMPRLNLEAEVGLYIWEGEVDLTGADLNPDLDGDTDYLLGLGASYNITDRLGAALLFKRVFFDEQEVDLIGLEGRFHF